ncbi:MAG: zeta toxin family protein [bacterium]|nr:zeta toxin family protein [bacterium]
MPTKKRIFIIAGANGTGKTTISKDLLKDFDLKFLNADEIAKSISSDNVDLSNIRLKAGKIFLSKLHNYIKQGISIALETTLAGKYIENIIPEAKQNGYIISIIYFFVDSPEVSIDRIQIRVKNGGHFVPEKEVIRRFYRSKENFWNFYRKIVDDWTVFYNGGKEPILTVTGKNENYKILNEQFFSIFKKDFDS